MATHKFEVKHTGRPFGPSERLEADDYTTISRHTTLSAARKRLNSEKAEMRRICGPNAWSDHFAVMPLVDTNMQGTAECYVCYKPVTIKYTWYAGTLNPWLDKLPAECPSCKERRKGMSHIEQYEDMVSQQEAC